MRVLVRVWLAIILVLAIACVTAVWLIERQPQEDELKPTVQHSYKRIRGFEEKRYPTPNYDKTRKNEVKGIVLHHTGELTLAESLEILSSPERRVSTHVVIDTDGTRYVILPLSLFMPAFPYCTVWSIATITR